MMGYARKVIIIPGYGLAVARRNTWCMNWMTSWKSGVESSTAIHPVAGRMPGHMNVLLAEADVPYPNCWTWRKSTRNSSRPTWR